MSDFLQSLFSRVKSRELSREAAVRELRQFLSKGSKTPASSGAVAVQTAHEILTYEEIWQPEPIPANSRCPCQAIVCFLSEQSHQDRFTAAIGADNRATRVVFVSRGDCYRQLSPTAYTVAPQASASYAELFRAIQANYASVDALLHLWSLEDATLLQETAEIATLLQGLSQSTLLCRQLLLCAAACNSVEAAYLDALVGFELSLRNILPALSTVIIGDLPPADAAPANPASNALAVEQWSVRLCAEMSTQRLESVMYQGDVRRVRRIVDRPQPADLPTDDMPHLRRGGTYLITGGLGGLGVKIAEFLVNAYAARLILVGRSPLDSERERQVAMLRAAGATVMYIAVDVCDEQEMRRAVESGQAALGRILGVIHAAGKDSTESVLSLEAGSFLEILRPKVQGTLVLERVLPASSLDFVCYFSSLAAVVGDFGACVYSIANRFLLAYARNQHARNAPLGNVTAINWPLWKEGGMQFAGDAQTHFYLKSSGQSALSTRAGLGMLEKLLQCGRSHTVVVVGEPSRVRRFLGMPVRAGEEHSTQTAIGTAPGNGDASRHCSSSTVGERVLLDLRRIAGELLKLPLEQVNATDNLADFGFDSLNLMQFARRISSHLDIAITPVVFFGYPTLGKLAEHFSQTQAPALQRVYGQQPPVGIPPAPRVPADAEAGLDSGPAPHQIGVSPARPEAIAIIGMSGRFPQARSVEAMWQVLREGKDAVEEIDRKSVV